jgi:hypothetical protein
MLGGGQARQNRRALDLNGLQRVRIEAQDREDRRSHLRGFHETVDGSGPEIGVGYQEHHVGVVVGEAAVLGLLALAPGVNHPTLGATMMSGLRGSPPRQQSAAGTVHGGYSGSVK